VQTQTKSRESDYSLAMKFFTANPGASVQEAQTHVPLAAINSLYTYKSMARKKLGINQSVGTRATAKAPKPKNTTTAAKSIGPSKKYAYIAYLLDNPDASEKEVLEKFDLPISSRACVIHARQQAKAILSGGKPHPFKVGSKLARMFDTFSVNPESKRYPAGEQDTINALYMANAVADARTMQEFRKAREGNSVTQNKEPDLIAPNDWREDKPEPHRYQLNFPETKEPTPVMSIFTRFKNSMTRARDTQVGGDHYQKLAVQPWEAMEVWGSAEQFEGYLRHSAIGYLARYPDKGGVEDVKKAKHYLERLIEHLEK